MSPVIRITDEVFERLQRVATPLVDTPASVIGRLLDFYDTHQKSMVPVPAPVKTQSSGFHSEARKFDPGQPPDLAHTRVISAHLDGRTASNWNELVHEAHRSAHARLKSYDLIEQATLAHIAKGRQIGKGFHYLSDIDVSIQNVGANIGWRNGLHLARKLHVPISVEFEWRKKEGAAYPGEKGILAWDVK